MPNQTVNKVQFGGQTVMDITDTTADAADVIEGEVFYSKSGARSVGSLGDATQSTHGLMSANDKTKLDGISGNVYSDYSVTIETIDWTLDNNVYTYTWTHSSVTYSCLVDILFITQPDTVLTGVLSYDKVSGGLQFTSTTLPTGDLSMKVRIIDSDTTWVIQQQNAFIDLDITLQASSWSNSSPYVQTWTSDKITDTCDVKVKFLEGALAASQLYIGYEKVSGGLQFTAPTKPTVNIPVRIHIINADPTAMENLDAEMVSTDAVSGAVNVQEALEAVDGKIGTLSSLTTSAKGSTVAAVNELNSKLTTVIPRNYFATVELTSIASKAYKVGEFMVFDNVLAKVDVAISQGDTISWTTNISRTAYSNGIFNMLNSKIGTQFVEVSGDSVTVNAHSTNDGWIPYTPPVGYKVIGITQSIAGGAGILWFYCYYDGTNGIRRALYNITDSSITCTPKPRVTLAKN